MPTHSVWERVRDLVRDALASEPAAGADLIASGLLDSLALVELIFAIEQEFGLAVPLDSLELDTFRSVDSIAAFVEAQIADAA